MLVVQKEVPIFNVFGKEDFKKMFKTIIPEEGWWL